MRRGQDEAGFWWGGVLPYCPLPGWEGAAYYWPDPWATSSREDELALLEDEAECLREQLETVEQRIGELKKKEK